MPRRTRSAPLTALLALLLLLAACGGGAAQTGAEGDTAESAADAPESAADTAESAAETDAAGTEAAEGDTASETEAAAETGAAEGGLLADRYDFSGATFRVGSKDFTETLLLGELARIALEATGATVELTDNLPSPAGARDALLADQIDMTYEYTSTAWINYLENESVEPGTDPLQLFEDVKAADLEANGVWWTTPASFDDTYGIAYREEAAADLGIETMSDLAAFVTENPDEATLCLDNTFGARQDGLPGAEQVYDFTWPDENQFVSDFGVVYTNTDAGEPCTFGEVFTTDGRIAGLGLKLIEDDQNAFLSYLSSMTMKEELYNEYPELEGLFAEIGEPLTEEVITAMNAAVDVDGEFVEDVAENYLREQGFIE